MKAKFETLSRPGNYYAETDFLLFHSLSAV